MSNVDIEEAIEEAIETLLWSETDDKGEPLDTNYGPADLHPTAVQAVREMVHGFIVAAEEERPKVFLPVFTWRWGTRPNPVFRGLNAKEVGYLFVLSANHHGAGFWDRGLGERGEWLHKMANGSGLDAYVGDDGLVYVS